MGVTSEIKDALSLITSVLNLGEKLYNASEKLQQFVSNVDELKSNYKLWETIAQEYGIDSDETLQFYVRQAKEHLKREEKKLKKLDSGCGWLCLFFCCLSTTDIPDSLGKSIVDLNKQIPERWKVLKEVKNAVQEQADILAAKPKLGFERDPSYIRIMNVEVEVKQCLNGQSKEDQKSQIVLLHGRAGSGKSSMARHLALEYIAIAKRAVCMAADEVPISNAHGELSADVDGAVSHSGMGCHKFVDVLYLECGDKAHLETKQEELLNMLWWPKPSNTEKNAVNVEWKLTQLLKDRSVLIILDDIWDGTFLRGIVKVCGQHVKILVTSQRKLLCEGVLQFRTKAIDMDRVARADSLKIFRMYAGFGDRNAPDDVNKCMEFLMDEVGGHPHAIASLAVAIDQSHKEDVRLWHNLVREYEVPLKELLPANTNDVQYEQSVLKAIQVKVDQLGQQEQELMTLLMMTEGSLALESVFELFHGEIMVEGSNHISSSSQFFKARKQLERLQCIKTRERDGKVYWFMHSLDNLFFRSRMQATVKQVLKTLARLPKKVQGLESDVQMNAIKLLGIFVFKAEFLRGPHARYFEEDIIELRWSARKQARVCMVQDDGESCTIMFQAHHLLQAPTTVIPLFPDLIGFSSGLDDDNDYRFSTHWLLEIISFMAKAIEPSGASLQKHCRVSSTNSWDRTCKDSSYQVFLSYICSNKFHRDASMNLLNCPTSRQKFWEEFLRRADPNQETSFIDEDVVFSVLRIYGNFELKVSDLTHGTNVLNLRQCHELVVLVTAARPEDKWLHGPGMKRLVSELFKSIASRASSEEKGSTLFTISRCMKKSHLAPSDFYEEAAGILVLLEDVLTGLNTNTEGESLWMHISPYLPGMLKFFGLGEEAAKVLNKYREKCFPLKSEDQIRHEFNWESIMGMFWRIRTLSRDWDGAKQDMKFYTSCGCPLDSSFYMIRAYLKHVEKDFRGALEDVDEAVKQDSKLEESVLPMRSHLKIFLGDMAGAAADLCSYHGKTSTRMRSELMQYESLFWAEKGVTLRLLGDLDGAQSVLDVALEIEPQDYEVLKQRGYVKFLRGDEEGAREDAEMALHLEGHEYRDVDFFPEYEFLCTSTVEFLGYRL